MAGLSDVISFSNAYLRIEQFDDYCPNGLQVEGKGEIKKIITGVTACQLLLDRAVAMNGDMILVHHGYFWKGENQTITGLKYNKIKTLIDNDINLVAYHLPLDAHHVCGNNAMLAKKLGVKINSVIGPGNNPLVAVGEFAEPLRIESLIDRIRDELGREPLHIGAYQNKKIQRVAICTGGAQNYFPLAIESGVDLFITGEVSEQQYHLAMESGVDFISAGHHATERYGVQAFGNILSKKFSIEVEYVEIPNPV